MNNTIFRYKNLQQNDTRNPFRNNFEILLPLAVLAAGFLFISYLVMQTRPGVFFSGDGGLKFLMADQFARGEFVSNLNLQAPVWVKQLWSQGLYPFQPQFVYFFNHNYYSQYPLFFSILTALPYSIFGFKGLYVFPALALFTIWCITLYLTHALEANYRLICLSLIFLIFASPLTLYGAMYWEHTLGIVLVISGLAIFLSHIKSDLFKAAVGGFLIGLSVWFRSEMACIVIVAIGLVWVPVTGAKLSGRRIFSLSIIMVLLLLVCFNLIFYGSSVGLHAEQLIISKPLVVRLIDVATNFRALVELTLFFYPVILVIITCSFFALFHAEDQHNIITFRFLFLTGILFIVLCPFFLPAPELAGYGGKQWGPRYFLVTVPIFCAITPFALQETWRRCSGFGRTILVASVAITVLWGVRLNSISGSIALTTDYACRVFPALRAVIQSPARIVLVEHQFIAQELATTMRNKSFVLTRNVGEMAQVCKSAFEHNETRLLLISDAANNYDRLRISVSSQPGKFMLFSLVGVKGIYAFHHVTLQAVGTEKKTPCKWADLDKEE